MCNLSIFAMGKRSTVVKLYHKIPLILLMYCNSRLLLLLIRVVRDDLNFADGMEIGRSGVELHGAHLIILEN